MKIKTKQIWAIRLTLIMLLLSPQLFANIYLQVTKFTIQLDRVSIKTVLEEIKKKTEFDFIYDYKDLNKLGLISIHLTDASVSDVLDECLKNTGFSHKVVDKTIILVKANNLSEQEKIKITGIVKDEQGEPLPGVTIILKGTNVGVASDMEGHFELSLPYRENIKLVFSSIGKASQEIEYKGQGGLNIVMKEDRKELEEVVVNGMQTIKKERMTGSYVTVTAKSLENQGITTLDNAIEGRVAGLNSMLTTGAPGARARITIRGENNLSGKTEPLWILNGLPMIGGVPKVVKGGTVDLAGTIMEDGVGNINPQDIESITVLKDAAATAMYGARAANGVIVITTKKGYVGDTRFSYTGTYSLSTAPRLDNIDMMNSAQKVGYELDLIDRYALPEITGRVGRLWTDYNKGLMTREVYEQRLNELRHTNTDWFDVIFRPANSQVHSLTARGGSERLTFYSSLRYEQKEGILENNQYRNMGANVNLDYRPSKKLGITYNMSVNARKNIDNGSAIDPFKYAVFANPYEKPYNADGSYASDLTYLPYNYSDLSASGYTYSNFNIMRELRETRKTSQGSDVAATISFVYKPVEGLNLSTDFRYSENYNTNMSENYPGTYTSYTGSQFAFIEYPQDKVTLPNQYNSGQFSEGAGRSSGWISRTKAEYSRLFKEKHFVSLYVANEVMSKTFNNFNYKAPTYDPDYRIIGFPKFPTSTKKLSDYQKALENLFYTRDDQDKSVSFVGALTYSFDDRYVGSFTMRADGADIIGTDQRYAPLWSAGLRWNIHKEKFMHSVEFISELAIKGSYGYTGSIDRSTYPFSTVEMSTDKYDGYLMAKRFKYANPAVKWEKKLDRNIGFECSLFNRRINLNADAYFNKTEDVLGPYNLPVSSGRTDITANTSTVQNRGWEATVNINWVDGKDFRFSTGFNVAQNRNKILKALNDIEDIRNMENQGGVKNLVGHETGSIYGWEFAGVWDPSGRALFNITDEAKVYYAQLMDNWSQFSEDMQKKLYESGAMPDIVNIPNAISFEETLFQQNNLGDEAKMMRRLSMVRLGNINPRIVGGFNSYMKYKNLEFTTSWSFKAGFIIPSFDDTKQAPGANNSDKGASVTNRTTRALYQWKSSGDRTDIPRFEELGYPYEYNSLTTSDKYEKGNYLRLQEATIAYSLPSHITTGWGINKLRASFQVRNLLTFTKYRGLDPATDGAFNYPQSKQFVFNLTVEI